MFTPQQLDEIRELEGTRTQAEIAAIYQVDRRTIGKIFNGRSYKTIESPPKVVEEILAAPPKIKMIFWSNT